MYFSGFCVLPGEIWGGDLRGLLLPKFGHCCWTLCQVQTAGGAVDNSGQELAVFPAGGCSCHQPQVINVTHYFLLLYRLNYVIQIKIYLSGWISHFRSDKNSHYVITRPISVTNSVGEISLKGFFVIFILVFYQSWRSGWNQTSCPLPCVISSLGIVSASRWFMCPTSLTSPIRMPPTRDSCKPFGQAFVVSLLDYFCWRFGNRSSENHSNICSYLKLIN